MNEASLLTLNASQSGALLLLMLRVAGFVIAAPFFGNRHVPNAVKAGFIAVLTVALARTAGVSAAQLPFMLAAPLEVAIGLTFGYVISLAILSFELIGHLIALQTGLSLGAVLNPASGTTGTPWDPLFSILASLLFLAANLHVAMVELLAKTLVLFPLGGGGSPDLVTLGIRLSNMAIELGIRIALPIALILLITDLAVALLTRVVPQINVFLLGLPLKLLAGFLLALVALPALGQGANSLFALFFRTASGAPTP